MTLADARAAAARARAFFENFSPADVDRLDAFYAPDARFRDPFSDVRGLAAIRGVFAHMVESLDDCRFAIRDEVVDEGGAMLTWDMTFRFRSWRPQVVQTIHGATHLRFDAEGRIAWHRDYWDAADELYAKLPVVGPLMRYLKRRMA